MLAVIELSNVKFDEDRQSQPSKEFPPSSLYRRRILFSAVEYALVTVWSLHTGTGI
jgi:hypothetical protein